MCIRDRRYPDDVSGTGQITFRVDRIKDDKEVEIDVTEFHGRDVLYSS